MTLTLAVILALIALICGILMLVSGRWSKWPLAAVAIICLALNQTGLLHETQRARAARLPDRLASGTLAPTDGTSPRPSP